MMRVFGFWVLFLMVGTAFMFLSFTTTTITSSSSSFPDTTFPSHGKRGMVAVHNRKLKEKIYGTLNRKNNKNVENVNLDDYHPIDPVPSSKTAITTGPIEHGTPLMPYIPKPGTPSHSKHGGDASPSPA